MKSVTRICTSYKQWHYIRKWIHNDELFNDFTDWIILNDCPSDPMPEDLKEIANERGIKVEEFEFNIGRCAARNFGVNISETKYIEHIDGDDLPLPLDQAFLENSSDDLIFFKIPHHQIDSSGRTIPVRDKDNNLFLEGNQPCQFYGSLFQQWGNVAVRPAGTLWNRDVFLSLGGYDERFAGAEDAHLVWKAYLKKVSYTWADFPKQSYLEENVYKLESEYFPQGFLKFWYLVKETGPEFVKDEVQRTINSAHRQLLWSCKADMKKRNPQELTFRIKESVKWVLLGT
ncbi:glycosyltransferase [Aetokthonos hydrillicola Thurmond2011]|jgi:glycosyltransferase involved in cell wall biosynthesis|uniref:Glycosyltransferase n=1 Tax=Aetokthonos hydrillicola Thurmond2011 TaxID=2712845 RepID=A0AAP5IDR2_9CYAN|nr:glycosyltransferase [Aetokthonos hydrillicola]MBW4590419.1 glycosyltransferase [Aetokthonos hydrillicola CCALA 1050]MDR9899753.1 glycosyltransferase [Aetokthonos hydrillicola Thurmond2011]